MAMTHASLGTDVAAGSRDLVLHSSSVILWGCFLCLLCAGFSFREHTVELVVAFDVPHR